MKQGCLIGLLLLGLVIGGYYVALTPYFEWPGNGLAALLAGVFASMFLSSVYGLGRAHRDARRLAASQTQSVSGLPDGEIIAIAGVIRPLNAPLQAPFSGTPCVAYDYEIVHRATRSTSDGTESYDAHDFAGLALTPSAIETPTGAVRLLSFAMLDEFPRQAHGSAGDRQRARAYIANTTFKPMGITKVFTAFSALNEALTDEDGAVRMDWRMTEGDVPLEKSTLRERLVTPGQQVSAVGRYNAAKRALIADGATSLIQLRPGDAKTAQRKILKGAWSSFGIATAFFTVSHGMLGVALWGTATRYQRETPARQESALRSAVQDKNANEVRRVINQGVDPNVRGSNGDTILHDLRDADMVRVLLKAGANPNVTNQSGVTPLMMAARMGLDDVVAALIEGGANVNVANADGETALSDAIEGEHPETVARLRAAGATADIVTAENGTPLPADGGEPMAVIRANIAAIHARDEKAIAATHLGKSDFSYTDWDGWHRIYPEKPVMLSGFSNGTRATLTVGGPTISQPPITWYFHLVQKGDVWRIARVWSTDKPPAPAPSRADEPVEQPRRR